MYKIIYISLLIFLFSACNNIIENLHSSDTYTLNIPQGFPQPSIPEDNQLTNTRVLLGKMLFYDPILSRDSTISCAHCHHPEKAFTDALPLSKGIEARMSIRNAPPLQNLAYQNSFMRDGGVPTIELQVLAPIEDHNEMDFNILHAAKRVANNIQYQKLSELAYGRKPDPYVITRALAAFERTLISGYSRYDDYLYRKGYLNASELRGKELFFSDSLNCSACHSGFNFTNGTFQNNGLYLHYNDPGRQRITTDSLDNGKFRVPSLRNIGYTAPYMHDGSKQTLEEVVDHYASGGQNHPLKSNLIKGFYLTQEDKKSLISFLNSLNDSKFVNNEQYKK